MFSSTQKAVSKLKRGTKESLGWFKGKSTGNSDLCVKKTGSSCRSLVKKKNSLANQILDRSHNIVCVYIYMYICIVYTYMYVCIYIYVCVIIMNHYDM